MKKQFLKKYFAATKLKYTSPIEEWAKAFPSADSLDKFRHEVGQLSWPETYGDSPWDYAFSIAYELHHGITESSLGFYNHDWNSGDSYRQKETLGKMQVLAHYGQAQAIQFLKDKLPCLISSK